MNGMVTLVMEEAVMSQYKDSVLSITTRGIGLGTCNLCYVAASAAGVEPPMYAMYRAFLGIAEAKLRDSGGFGKGVYKCHIMPNMINAARYVNIVPSPIRRIIDAIDVITHNGTTYTPVVAAQVKDDEGRLVPRPENLLLSNLREVVVALSSPWTPVTYRAAFKANCPIPGAVWDNDLLTNSNEIIKEGYNLRGDWLNDMWPLQMFLITMQERYPLMAGGPLSRRGESETLAAFISNSMGDLRAEPRHGGESLQDYCRRCHPQGFQGPYYQLEELSRADVLAGQVALLGELPNVAALGEELLAPVLEVHAARRGTLNYAQFDTDDYVVSLMMTNAALLYPSAPQPARGDAPEAALPARGDAPEAVPPARNDGGRGRGRGRGPRNRRGNQNRN